MGLCLKHVRLILVERMFSLCPLCGAISFIKAVVMPLACTIWNACFGNWKSGKV